MKPNSLVSSCVLHLVVVESREAAGIHRARHCSPECRRRRASASRSRPFSRCRLPWSCRQQRRALRRRCCLAKSSRALSSFCCIASGDEHARAFFQKLPRGLVADAAAAAGDDRAAALDSQIHSQFSRLDAFGRSIEYPSRRQCKKKTRAEMQLGLRGKVAVVTGASRGIGKAIAQALLEEGCAVAICGRNAERLDAAVAELSAKTAACLGVADRRHRRKCGEANSSTAVLEPFGRIDILVNNAGTHLRGTVETTTLDDPGSAIARQGVRVFRHDKGGAADDEGAARRAYRQHRRAGGAPSASGPVSVRRHQCGVDGDEQVGRRCGRARQYPRQCGVPAIHRVRAAGLADRRRRCASAGSIARPRRPASRAPIRWAAPAGRTRSPIWWLSWPPIAPLSSPAARSASTAAITATCSGRERMDLGLTGKTALITGGTSGIGLAIAQTLARGGLQNRDLRTRQDQARRGALPRLARQKRKGFVADICKPGDVAALVGDVTEAFGGIDIVVSNAGTHLPGRLERGRDRRAAAAFPDQGVGRLGAGAPRRAGHGRAGRRPLHRHHRPGRQGAAGERASRRRSSTRRSMPSSNRCRTNSRRAIFWSMPCARAASRARSPMA